MIVVNIAQPVWYATMSVIVLLCYCVTVKGTRSCFLSQPPLLTAVLQLVGHITGTGTVWPNGLVYSPTPNRSPLSYIHKDNHFWLSDTQCICVRLTWSQRKQHWKLFISLAVIKFTYEPFTVQCLLILKEMFYLTMHSTHFIYSYVVSDIL